MNKEFDCIYTENEFREHGRSVGFIAAVCTGLLISMFWLGYFYTIGCLRVLSVDWLKY